MENLKIETYRASKTGLISVYILSNESLEINKAIDFLSHNYTNHENCELIEESEPSVAQHYGYKYCVVFHDAE